MIRIKNPLLSLDATMIDLCPELFPWATYQRLKGTVKLHFTLDHEGYLPSVLVITEGKVRETTIAQQQRFAAGLPTAEAWPTTSSTFPARNRICDKVVL